MTSKPGLPVDPNDDTAVVRDTAPWTPESIKPEVVPSGDASLVTGTMLGEYRIEALIGEGGMGKVYSAIHPRIGKRAAIKVLKKDMCRDPVTVQRFVDEARVVNQIGHPNIVDVFSFGETPDGRSYFAMEWLKGLTLRERTAHRLLAFDEICAIMKQLARALEAAHQHGVIHRDLKPDNVFLLAQRDDEPPTVKLLDFGIAKLAPTEHHVERTAAGSMIGTPQYIAPEQAKGYIIDHRADIYSFGALLFELLTGRTPFLADNAMEIIAKHLMEPPPRPSSLASVPAELDQLVLGMLSKTADERPSLAEAVIVLDRQRNRLLDEVRRPGELDDAFDSATTYNRRDSKKVPARGGSLHGFATSPMAATRWGPTARVWIVILCALLVGFATFIAVRALRSSPATTSQP